MSNRLNAKNMTLVIIIEVRLCQAVLYMLGYDKVREPRGTPGSLL